MIKFVIKQITSVSLFIKIMGIALLIIVIFGASVIFNTRHITESFFEEQSKKRLIMTAKYFTLQVEEFLITGDFANTYNLIKDTLKLYDELRYIIIYDTEDRILFNSTNRPLSKEFINANKLKDDYNIEIINTEFGRIYDIILPISFGNKAYLRMGMDSASTLKRKDEITNRLLYFFAFIAFVGILISYTLAAIINIPIKNLINAIDKIKKGNLNVRVRPWFDDEIGKLSQEFNNMTETIYKEQLARRELIQKLIKTQEEERLRISRELHDRTGQSISSIKMAIRSIELSISDVNIKKRFSEFAEILNTTLEDIHSLSLELRNPLLTDFGLVKAIEEEIATISKNNKNIEISFIVGEEVKNRRFAKEIEVQMFRIFQEALLNAIKHSSATHIKIFLQKEDASSITMKIIDNGRGIVENPERRGIGLIGMKERAEIIKADLKIISNKNEGTHIILSVPINSEDRLQ